MALKSAPWAQDPQRRGVVRTAEGAGHRCAPLRREWLEMEPVGSERGEGGVSRGHGEGPPSQALLRAAAAMKFWGKI